MPTLSDEARLSVLLGAETRGDSSNVQAIQYDASTQTLVIGFGKPEDAVYSYYTYANVPPEMAEDLANSPSQGVWVWDNLRRKKWPFTRGIEGVSKLYPQSS